MRNINDTIVAMSSFAERLKLLREKRSLAQDDLSAHLGVARSTIGGYEAPSKQREPEFEVVSKLATFFDVSIDYLMGRSDDASPPWISKLPPDMQEFVKEESQHGWPFMRLAKGLKMQDLTREELIAIIETWQDAKQQHERDTRK